MDRADIDWSLFRSFLAVVDSGSLLGAAKRLGSHQPTLSRQIAQLESQLGAVLFERTGRGLTPTLAGRAIVDGARQMEAAVGAIQTGLMGVSSAVGGTVRIAASEIVAAYLLPECLVALRQAHPRIQIEVVASNHLSNLLRREADIALRMVQPIQSNLIGRRLGDLQLGAYASSAYLAHRNAPTSLESLTAHDLIGLDTDDSLIQGLNAAGLGLSRENFAIRTDHQAVYVEMIRAGAGIGVMPICVGERMPDLRLVLPPDPAFKLPTFLVVHREIQDNPTIRAVYDGLAANVSSRLRLGAHS